MRHCKIPFFFVTSDRTVVSMITAIELFERLYIESKSKDEEADCIVESAVILRRFVLTDVLVFHRFSKTPVSVTI